MTSPAEIQNGTSPTLQMLVLQLLNLTIQESCNTSDHHLDLECRQQFISDIEKQLSRGAQNNETLPRTKRDVQQSRWPKRRNRTVEEEVVLTGNVRLLLYCGPKKGEEQQVLEGPCRDSFFKDLQLAMQATVNQLRNKRSQMMSLGEVEERRKFALDKDFLRMANINSLSYCNVRLGTMSEANLAKCRPTFLQALDKKMQVFFSNDTRILPAYHERNEQFIKQFYQEELSLRSGIPSEPDNNEFTNLNREERESKLNQAAGTGDLNTVISLLDLGTDPQRALRTAIAANQNSVVKKLIEAGANVNAQYERGFRPLHFAVSARNVEAARMLLSAYANLNAKTSLGQTPLHLAAALNDLGMCRFLVRKGADINSQDNDGNTPVMAAVYHAELPLIKILTRRGFEPWMVNKSGKTAWQIARMVKKKNIARYLRRIELLPRPINPNIPEPTYVRRRQEGSKKRHSEIPLH